MKQIAVLMVLLGLSATGCVQSKVFGPQAKKSNNQNIRAALDSMNPSQGDIQLTGFGGGCDDTCCGDCSDGCCGGDGCCGDGSCGNGSCGNGRCGNGRCGLGDRCRGLGGSLGSCNPHAVGYPEPQNFNPGPPTGQVAYPYYTVRGPRDFLRNNPPSIGPY